MSSKELLSVLAAFRDRRSVVNRARFTAVCLGRDSARCMFPRGDAFGCDGAVALAGAVPIVNMRASLVLSVSNMRNAQ